MRQFKGNPVKMSISEDELRDLVYQGKTDREIGKMLKVCSVTAQHWRQRLGLASPYANRKRKPVERERKHHVGISREELVHLYETEGLSQREIALRLGVHQVSVSNWLRKHGIEARPDGGRVAVIIPEDALRDLYLAQERTMEEIASVYGCSDQTVRQNLARYGLQLDATEIIRRRLKRLEATSAYRYEHRGYVSIRQQGHPSADSNGYINEHRVVAESALGRYLNPGEQVHHINLCKRDNRIENLAVMPSNSAHRQVHSYVELVGIFLCGLTDIRPEALDFGAPVFWGGRWVTSIDLIPPGVRPVSGQLSLGETTSQVIEKEVVN